MNFEQCKINFEQFNHTIEHLESTKTNWKFLDLSNKPEFFPNTNIFCRKQTQMWSFVKVDIFHYKICKALWAVTDKHPKTAIHCCIYTVNNYK